MFFEDRDGDAKIKTESMTSDPDSLEVLQRNYYYPFGLEMEGPWQAATAPRADYLYNGKELEEDLKLNWYAYGFRYYDPSIGRFTGVDPIGEQFAELSVYNYASNNPISKIDLHGLQGAEGVWITQWLINKYFAAKYRVEGHLNNLNQGATRSNPVINNAPISQGSKDFLHKAQTNAGAAGIANEVLQTTEDLGTTVIPQYAAAAGLRDGFIEADNGNYWGALFMFAMVPMDMGPGGPRMVKHHIFNVFRGNSPGSQKYRDFFSKHIGDVHNYTVEIPESLHKEIHGAGNNWTTRWKTWIDANPDATTEEVFQQADIMRAEYGIADLPYVRY